MSLASCPNRSLSGTQPVCWLNFTAASNQASGFAVLSLTDGIGVAAEGGAATRLAPQSLRLVLVGEEPLLEWTHGTNGEPLLMLYGKPGPGYSIQSQQELGSSLWEPAISNLVCPASLWLRLTPPETTRPQIFYRAVRAGP